MQSSGYLRDRSCLLLCSLLLKARLQNWHLYFFSGAEALDDFFAEAGEFESAGIAVSVAAGIAVRGRDWLNRS